MMRRCGAHSRTTGEPCRNPPMRWSTRCRMHGGASPAARRKAADRKLYAEAAAFLASWRAGEEPDAAGVPKWWTAPHPRQRWR
jgi:hypothetical protein